MNRNHLKTKKLVLCAILTALVIVLQFMGSFIHFGPFSISVVLVPISIGAALCGVGAGAWLGLVFGIVVLFTDSTLFLAFNPAGTVLTVLAKGALAGLLAALAYRLAAKFNAFAGTVAAAFVCPIVNTGVFLIGCRIFFMELIGEWSQAEGFPSAGNYLIFVMVGLNFIFELITNLILSPVIARLIRGREQA